MQQEKNFNSKIIEILKKSKHGKSVTEVSSELNLNRNSVAKYLDILLISGKVQMRKMGPAKLFYYATHIPFTGIMNISSSCLLFLNDKLEIVNANNKLLEKLILDKKDIVGHKINNFRNCLLSEKEVIAALNKVNGGKEHNLQIKNETPSCKGYYNFKMIPITYEDNTTGVLAIIDDVTKIKEADELYKAIFENSGTAICIINQNNTIHEVNDEFEKFSGYKKSELLNTSWTRLIEKKELSRIQEYNVSRKNDPNSAPRNYNTQVVRKDGTIVNSFFTVSLIPDSKKIVVSAIDINSFK